MHMVYELSQHIVWPIALHGNVFYRLYPLSGESVFIFQTINSYVEGCACRPKHKHLHISDLLLICYWQATQLEERKWSSINAASNSPRATFSYCWIRKK